MYRVVVRPHVWKDMAHMSEPLKERIIQAMRSLEKTQRPVGCKRLVGDVNCWRARIGDYRMLYKIFDREKLVIVFRVRHWKDAYRK